MDPFVVEMHTRSGLLDAIAASTVTLADAGAADARLHPVQHAPEPRTVPLCGNSIGTDRRFLAAYLPAIEEHLHYRSIDVSSVKELVRRWYPKIGQARPQKTGQHRALDDIRDSIDELRYYRQRVFVPADANGDTAHRGGLTCGRSSSPSTAAPTCCASRRSTPPVPGPDELLVDVHHTAAQPGRRAAAARPLPGPPPRRAGSPPRSPASSTPASSPPSATGSRAGPSATR